MDRPHALSLDLDGTLLDDRGMAGVISRTCDAIARIRPDLNPGAIARANAQEWGAYLPEFEDDWTLGRLSGADVRREAWRRTLRSVGCDDDEVIAAAVDLHAQIERASYRLFEDAARFLEALNGRYPLALITNGASDTQREKLFILGIEQLFREIIVSGEIGVAKPEVAVFERASVGLGVPIGHLWHVGDSLANDIAGANAAGSKSVWINRTGAPRSGRDPGPDLEVASLDEVAELVAGFA